MQVEDLTRIKIKDEVSILSFEFDDLVRYHGTKAICGLTDAVAQDVALGRADVLILGGGPLSGRAETLTPPSGIKMIDAFDATLWQSLALASMNKLSGTNP